VASLPHKCDLPRRTVPVPASDRLPKRSVEVTSVCQRFLGRQRSGELGVMCAGLIWPVQTSVLAARPFVWICTLVMCRRVNLSLSGGRDREPRVLESQLLVVSRAALVRASRTVTQRSSPASCRRRTRVMEW